MLIRQKFVTNSSSVSFIAWGLIVPVDEEKEKEFSFLEAYRGNDHAAVRKDGVGHYLIYAKMSIIDTEDCNVTLFLDDSIAFEKIKEWSIEVKKFAAELGLDIENKRPGWFFTRYDS
jgi:hypothetical protein